MKKDSMEEIQCDARLYEPSQTETEKAGGVGPRSEKILGLISLWISA